MFNKNVMYREISRALALCVVGVSPAVLSASLFQPAEVAATEGLGFTPTVTVALGHDDNLTSAKENTSNSSFSQISTTGDLVAGNEITNFAASYGVVKGIYFDSSSDNYLDYNADFLAQHEFTARHRVDASIGYLYSHEPRGTGLSEGAGNAIGEPTEYSELSAAINYGLGAESATFNMKFNLGYKEKSYENYREISQYREFDSSKLGATAYYQIMPKTKLLIDASYENIAYATPAVGFSAQDSAIVRTRLGVEWDATAKTSGFIKVGLQDKDFDDSGRADFSGLTWDVGVTWQPRTYSTFTFATGMEAKDPNVEGDYIEEASVSAGWNHNWLERFSTRVNVSYTAEDYTGVAREDTRTVVDLGVDYDFRRFMKASLSYLMTNQDSTSGVIEYDKNLVMLSVTASL